MASNCCSNSAAWESPRCCTELVGYAHRRQRKPRGFPSGPCCSLSRYWFSAPTQAQPSLAGPTVGMLSCPLSWLLSLVPLCVGLAASLDTAYWTKAPKPTAKAEDSPFPGPHHAFRRVQETPTSSGSVHSKPHTQSIPCPHCPPLTHLSPTASLPFDSWHCPYPPICLVA